MDNSVIARQIVDDAKRLPQKEVEALVEGTLNQLESLYSAEKNATVKNNKQSVAEFIEQHKPFLINLIRKVGGLKLGGHYQLILTYDPKDNSLAWRGA